MAIKIYRKTIGDFSIIEKDDKFYCLSETQKAEWYDQFKNELTQSATQSSLIDSSERGDSWEDLAHLISVDKEKNNFLIKSSNGDKLILSPTEFKTILFSYIQ